MKKVLVVLLVVLLTGCGGSLTFKDEILTSDHFVVRFGHETHFEAGILMEEMIMVSHNDIIHYEFYGIVYLPNDDGTFTIIPKEEETYVGYIMNIYKSIPDISVEDLHKEIEDNEFKTYFLSGDYYYRDEEKHIRIFDKELSSLEYFVDYFNNEWIFQYEIITEDMYTLPEYTLFSNEVTDILFNDLDYMTMTDKNTLEGVYQDIQVTVDLETMYAYIQTSDLLFRFDMFYYDACIVETDDTIDCSDISSVENGVNILTPIGIYIREQVPSQLLNDLDGLAYEYTIYGHYFDSFREVNE